MYGYTKQCPKYDLVLSEREHEHEREHLSNVQAELMQSTLFLKFNLHWQTDEAYCDLSQHSTE